MPVRRGGASRRRPRRRLPRRARGRVAATQTRCAGGPASSRPLGRSPGTSWRPARRSPCPHCCCVAIRGRSRTRTPSPPSASPAASGPACHISRSAAAGAGASASRSAEQSSGPCSRSPSRAAACGPPGRDRSAWSCAEPLLVHGSDRRSMAASQAHDRPAWEPGTAQRTGVVYCASIALRLEYEARSGASGAQFRAVRQRGRPVSEVGPARTAVIH